MQSNLPRTLFWAALVASTTLVVFDGASAEPAAEKAPAGKPDTELATLAEDAYLYGYPLVLMDATMRAMTNVPEPKGEKAPVNQFARVDVLPDASFTSIVRPNVDTLYTSAFLDLEKEPIVLHMPDTQGRYYLMPMLDAYTNVFASPGKRTMGTKAKDFAIVGPGWKGTLPKGVTKIQAPTNLVWVLGRTQINGKDDLPSVVALTKDYTLTPLSTFGQPYTPPKNDKIDTNVTMEMAPPRVVAAMDDPEFFTRLAALMKENPPSAKDRAAVARFKALGLEPGKFEPSEAAKGGIEGAGERARKRMDERMLDIGKLVNGWRMDTSLGSYGTRYLDRAVVALDGLGANLAADALYPMAFVDEKGEPLNGENRYVLHFAKGKEPPVNAFWSVTLYDPKGYLAANPIDRFAIGSRDKLKRNKDGSLDILIQSEPPEGDMAANWLPAPKGEFNLALRLYWPKQQVVSGAWKPPAVKKAE